MKIAVVTNDGQTISQHFGRSRYYAVLMIENGEVVDRELRQHGVGHYNKQNTSRSHEHHTKDGKHGYGPEAQSRHATMAREIADCSVLIAGGMGMGAYESFKSAGLDVFLTDHQMIEDAVVEYVRGNLRNFVDERTD